MGATGGRWRWSAGRQRDVSAVCLPFGAADPSRTPHPPTRGHGPMEPARNEPNAGAR